MGSVKSQVLLFLDIFNRSKTRGGISDKNFCDETKILLDIWISDHGRDNRRFLIVCGFKTILTIYGHICIIYGQYNKYSLIYKKYIIEEFAYTCDYVQW